MKRKLRLWLAILMSIVTVSVMPGTTALAAQTIYDNDTGTHGGYNYELWKDYGTTSMTLNDGGTFSCQWSNIGNALFRKGKKYNSDKTYQQLGGISCEYSCNYNPSGNSYLCIYGWTREPLVEYYIVESWGSWRPPGSNSKGTITVDGATYDIYETTRVNQPSIDGNTTFQQYWSVRQNKRTSGTINVSEHFKQWEARGMRMGKMYEVALTVEGYQSSGSANVTKNNIYVGTSPNPTSNPNPAPDTRSAFTTIEAEEYNSANSSTIEEIGTSGSGKGIGYIENGNTTTYKQIDFGNGANKFTATVATEQDTTIQIRSGSATGTLLGTLSVGSTGSWDSYKEMSTTISNISGKKDIVLVFSGPVNVDNFVFSGNGQVQPTTGPEPTSTPSGDRSAYSTIQAEDYDSSNATNIQTFNLSQGGSAIGYIENGNAITFKNVDFSNGAASVTAKVASQMSNTTIQVRAGGQYGTLLGTISVPNTNSWDSYQNVTQSISNVTGVTDITLVFSGPVNVDSFVFKGSSVAPTATPVPTTGPNPTATPTPRPTATPVPNTQDAYSNIQAENYDSKSGSNMETFNLSNGGSAIGYIENGYSTTYKNVNFGDTGALSITATVATEQDTSIQVRAGGSNGTLLGTINVGSTGSWDTYSNVSASISKTTGVKDITLVFSGAVNVDSFKFSTKKASGGGSGNTQNATLLNTYGSLLGNMGTCINYNELQDSNRLNALKQQYNSITLENEMKPDAILGSNPSLISVQEARNLGYYIPSNWQDSMVPRLNFSTVDNVMRICSQNGLKMRAHTLVWHSQTPGWFFRSNFNGSYGFVSTQVMDAREEFYVKSMINHVYNNQYGDCVYAWDVVNEHLHAQNSGWAGVYGNAKNASFVKNAFQYASDALKALGKRNSVKLFYNDYNTYEVTNDIVNLVKYINQNGKNCDGVGMQAHLDTSFPSAASFKSTIQTFLNNGFEVQITEFDATNNNESTQASYCYDIFKGILDCVKAGGNITGITVWGMYDSISWRASQNPLLFSGLNQPKQSYNSVLKAYTDSGFSVGEVGTNDPDPDDDPTPTPTGIPSGNISATDKIQAEDYDSNNASNIETFNLSEGGSAIGYIENGNAITFKNVDFGDGVASFKARVATENSTSIEIHANSVNGTLLGTLSVGSTGSWDTYREMSTNVSNITGVKDLVLVFSGAVNVDWFTFSKSGSAQTDTPDYTGKKLVAITFDDGPNTQTTPQILDILEREGVVASFFLIGQNINDSVKSVMQRQLALGCELNNHSWSHSDMGNMNYQQCQQEIQNTSNKIYQMVGVYPKFFRPPYISTSNTMYQAIDLPFICGMTCNDWENSTSAWQRSQTVLNNVKDGDIILLHDFAGNNQTVEALSTIIQGLKDRGYAFVTVSQLFELKGINPKQEYKMWNGAERIQGTADSIAKSAENQKRSAQN